MSRIFVIHHNRLFREGIGFALERHDDFDVVGSAAKAEALLPHAERLRPDIVLLDLHLPDRAGLGEARFVRSILTDTKILIFGVSELESDVLACIEVGASGYLPLEASLPDLIENLRAMAAGRAICSQSIVGMLFSRVADDARQREKLRVLDLPNLTHREREIVHFIEQGCSNKDIAATLHIQLQTVKNHVHNILEKLHVSDRRQAAHIAREWGLFLPLRSRTKISSPAVYSPTETSVQVVGIEETD